MTAVNYFKIYTIEKGRENRPRNLEELGKSIANILGSKDEGRRLIEMLHSFGGHFAVAALSYDLKEEGGIAQRFRQLTEINSKEGIPDFTQLILKTTLEQLVTLGKKPSYWSSTTAIGYLGLKDCLITVCLKDLGYMHPFIWRSECRKIGSKKDIKLSISGVGASLIPCPRSNTIHYRGSFRIHVEGREYQLPYSETINLDSVLEDYRFLKEIYKSCEEDFRQLQMELNSVAQKTEYGYFVPFNNKQNKSLREMLQ